MIKITAYAALAMAGLLLSLQVLLGLEYTEGGSIGTQASMIAAMVTLAALPVFIEAARQAGARGVALALFVAFISFLAYSLPATTGRTGEIKETKVSAAGDVAGWKAEADSLTKSLIWARPEMLAECDGAPDPLPPQGWPKCRRTKATVTSLQERQAKLESMIAKAGPTAGDLGSDLWASALGLSPAVVRQVSVMSFAIGLDVVIWSLIWFATTVLTAVPKASNDNRPGVSDSFQTDFPPPPAARMPEVKAIAPETNVIRVWAERFETKYGRKPSVKELQAAFPDESRTTVWRKSKAA
jgi:hypothetical protein